MINKYHSVKRLHGFTLLETLVALSVLAITLGVLYQIFGVSLKNIQYAKDYSYAQMLAESKLSELGKGIPIVEGIYGGDFDGKYSWEISIESQTQAAAQVEDRALYAYKVRFTIFWPSNGTSRSIKIDTYRLSTGEA